MTMRWTDAAGPAGFPIFLYFEKGKKKKMNEEAAAYGLSCHWLVSASAGVCQSKRDQHDDDMAQLLCRNHSRSFTLPLDVNQKIFIKSN